MLSFRNYEKDFEQFFWEKKDMIEKIAWKYSKNQAVVDDLIQQIFLKIFLNMKKIVKVKNQEGYVYRLAVNEIMDYFRKHKDAAFTISFSTELESVLADNMISSEEHMNQLDIMEKFKRILSHMAPKRRNVVSLRVVEDMNFKEISHVLSISEESARNLYSIGMKEVRKQLGRLTGGSYA